jgi:hypothetical protein
MARPLSESLSSYDSRSFEEGAKVMDVSVFEIDLGKNSCSVVGLDTTGKLVGDRTSLMNQIRSLLLERGHIVPQGRAKLAGWLAGWLAG